MYRLYLKLLTYELRLIMIYAVDIACIEGVIEEIEPNEIINDRPESVIPVTINFLDRRKDKVIKRSETNNF